MFFSLELNENSQTVKKSLEQRLRQLLYIFEGQKEEKIKNIRSVYTRPSSQSFPWGNSLVWPRSAAGADLGGGYRGCAPPPPLPPPPEMTCGFLIQLVFRKKKNYAVYWC